MEHKKSGSDLFIVDNSDNDWKVREYLREWTDIAHQFDIATGYFEIGALLALDGQWQKLDKLRLLMGDEVTKRTRDALNAGLAVVSQRLDESIESEKEKNDFLTGVPAIVDALQRGQIECRIYAKKKFHAKAYITHSKLAVVGSSALVGSSNFTSPGLSQNVELNVQLRREVEILQEWYEQHWNQAEDVTPAILKVIERHTREYTPFEIYLKSLHEYFRGHEMTVDEWERKQSRVFPLLDGYQQEGYQALMKKARDYNGAFLCDGVGLGKTFVGLMLIERLIEKERKRVALFVPKSARGPVWETTIDRYLPHLHGVFSNLIIFSHSDFNSSRRAKDLVRVKEMADVVLIDEAHHFRNPGAKGDGTKRPSRYRQMYELLEGKTVFLLTATPVNNHLSDLQHMIELFSRRQTDYFRRLGIHSLPGHFRKMEKDLERMVKSQEAEGEEIETNQVEADMVLSSDGLFRELVVQRSRAYVKKSQEQQGIPVTLFPRKQDPQVAEYSVKKTYGRLLDALDRAFAKKNPLFSLAIYNPVGFYRGNKEDIDILVRGRQKQVVALIRTQFLKRFESSAHAFKLSCERLLAKLLAFIEKHGNESEKGRLERWKNQKAERLGFFRVTQRDLFSDQLDLSEAEEEDDFDGLVTEEMLAAMPELKREEYKVDEIINETFLDLDQIVDFLNELKQFEPRHDDKLRALVRLLKNDPVLKRHKVIIFSEFKDTAQYLLEQLQAHGIEGVEEIDSDTKEDRGRMIKRFAPYYNGSSSVEIAAQGKDEIRVLISTDVLAEGLNLQDATRLINYDLHWNPVRLVQRIGRIDRRLNADIEALLLAAHPEQKVLRGTVAYWNFIPPDELDDLLKLYKRVSHKTLRISRTFGIEGKKLLKPEDDYEALRDFIDSYEGQTTDTEQLELEYKRLLLENPGLAAELDGFPKRVFSGKAHPQPGVRAVFFCYALPAARAGVEDAERSDAALWTEAAGRTAWYLYDLASERIEDEITAIVSAIRCAHDTPRQRAVADETLAEIRAKIERHIKNSYFKKVQAPVGVKATLKAWMEIA